MPNYTVINGIWLTDGSEPLKKLPCYPPQSKEVKPDAIATFKIKRQSNDNKIVCWISGLQPNKKTYVQGEIKSTAHFALKGELKEKHEKFNESEIKNKEPKQLFWPWPNNDDWTEEGVYSINLQLGYAKEDDKFGKPIWEKEIYFFPFAIAHK